MFCPEAVITTKLGLIFSKPESAFEWPGSSTRLKSQIFSLVLEWLASSELHQLEVGSMITLHIVLYGPLCTGALHEERDTTLSESFQWLTEL